MVRAREADFLLILMATNLGLSLDERSPIEWSQLSRVELAGRLREIADWTRTNEAQFAPGSVQLREVSLDLAEQLERRRERGREDRGR